jgi:predicted ATPase
MRQFLAQLARSRTVVLFLDDLQWADLATLDLLHFIASDLSEMPVTILAAYRPAELKERNPAFNKIRTELKMRGTCEDMQLDFLDSSCTQLFIDSYFSARTAGEHRLPDAVAGWLSSHFGGHPLFMNAMLDECVARGRIAYDQGVWKPASDPSSWGYSLPESVSGIITGRIEELSPEDREILRAAAIHGGQFDAELLAEALKRDTVQVEQALDRLANDEYILRACGEISVSLAIRPRTWRFSHAVYREQLLRSTGPAEAARLAKLLSFQSV